MQSFKDTAGRVWTLEIDADVIEYYRSQYDIDLSSADNRQSFFDDNCHKLFMTVAHLIDIQAILYRITPDEFLKAMDVLTVASAQLAFLREWASALKKLGQLKAWIQISRVADFQDSLIRKLRRAQKHRVQNVSF